MTGVPQMLQFSLQRLALVLFSSAVHTSPQELLVRVSAFTCVRTECRVAGENSENDDLRALPADALANSQTGASCMLEVVSTVPKKYRAPSRP